MSDASRRTAVVLSGGGARGAYEAGVLSYVYSEVSRRLGRQVHFDIITGTSVGAINACYLAGAQGDAQCGQRLAAIWRSLSFESVMSLSVPALARLPWQLLGGRGKDSTGGRRLRGLFNTQGLEALVRKSVRWDLLRRNIDEGDLLGLAVTATEIASGRSRVFVDCAGPGAPVCAADPLVVTEPAQIGPDHALASASIPLIFPAIKIGARFFSDGGLRMNTPLSPALRLGADKVLVIGLKSLAEDAAELVASREAIAQSPLYLAGKALNALLLDRVEYDLDRMRLFNDILRNGVEAFGDGFLERINEPIVAHRGRPYRIVDSLFIRPSADLGVEAAECLRSQLRSATGGYLRRSILRYLADSDVSEADVLSYLYFDGCYAARLMEMGRRDAAAVDDELVEFFES